jgi:hypothetical protein
MVKNNKARNCGLCCFRLCLSAPGQGGDHVFGLQAFVTLHDGKLYALAFDQYAVAFAANGAEVNKDVITRVAGDKAEAFGGVEPLDRAGFTVAAKLTVMTLARLYTQVAGKVQGHRDYQGQQAEHNGGLVGDGRQWGQQNQGLQQGGQYEHCGHGVLQGMTQAGVPDWQLWCQDQIDQAKQGKTQSVGLLQEGLGGVTEARDGRKHKGTKAGQ